MHLIRSNTNEILKNREEIKDEIIRLILSYNLKYKKVMKDVFGFPLKGFDKFADELAKGYLTDYNLERLYNLKNLLNKYHNEFFLYKSLKETMGDWDKRNTELYQKFSLDTDVLQYKLFEIISNLKN
jgi:hypothetical protein